MNHQEINKKERKLGKKMFGANQSITRLVYPIKSLFFKNKSIHQYEIR
jgi:hypothetical protein